MAETAAGPNGNPVGGLFLAQAKEAEKLATKLQAVADNLNKSRAVLVVRRDLLERVIFSLNANSGLLRQVHGLIAEKADG